MKRSDKATKIIEILEELYPVIHIPLDHVNNYTFLIAVMLSAQSTDKKVNQITPALFKRAQSPYEMVELSVKQIEEYIREIGLAPTKARNVRKMSEQLIESHNGEVPSSFEELELLAGVGHKTASVIMSQAFGHPAFPVDTHIHRLAARWGLSTGKNVVQTEKDLKSIFPIELWHKLHLQIIFFGREHCPARNHDLSNCLICKWAATKKRIMEES